MPGVTFTIDVEDHRPGPHAELRFPRVTHQVVDWLAGQGIRGTFFVVGEESRRHPGLIRAIADGGHELALHGDRHVPVGSLTPEELAADVRRGIDGLQQLGGVEVTGFRAPQFSLVAGCEWVADVLAEAGCTYSSSVLPAASPLFGYPGAPTTPFRWPSGLVEFPATLLPMGPVSVPLGGVYFRLLPGALTQRLVGRAAGHGSVPWLYLHPYDFDPDERMYVVRDAAAIASPLQWVNRRRVEARVAQLLGRFPAAPLGERLDEVGDVRFGGTSPARHESG